MTELISVIVATYNREDALDGVLRGLSRQNDRDFEVIVADDGSGPETVHVVELWSSRMGVPMLHVRQEDRGFRLAEIRDRRYPGFPVAEVNADGVSVQTDEVQAGKMFNVNLTFAPDFKAKLGQPVEFTVKTTNPKFPMMRVPIMQIPTPAPLIAKPVPTPQAAK